MGGSGGRSHARVKFYALSIADGGVLSCLFTCEGLAGESTY